MRAGTRRPEGPKQRTARGRREWSASAEEVAAAVAELGRERLVRDFAERREIYARLKAGERASTGARRDAYRTLMRADFDLVREVAQLGRAEGDVARKLRWREVAARARALREDGVSEEARARALELIDAAELDGATADAGRARGRLLARAVDAGEGELRDAYVVAAALRSDELRGAAGLGRSERDALFDSVAARVRGRREAGIGAGEVRRAVDALGVGRVSEAMAEAERTWLRLVLGAVEAREEERAPGGGERERAGARMRAEAFEALAAAPFESVRRELRSRRGAERGGVAEQTLAEAIGAVGAAQVRYVLDGHLAFRRGCEREARRSEGRRREAWRALAGCPPARVHAALAAEDGVGEQGGDAESSGRRSPSGAAA